VIDADRIYFALNNPPLETEPPAGEEHTFTITGTKTLRRPGVDPGGAQVVTGYFDGDETAVCLAKIYDGVYYPLDPDISWDPMTLADSDYATEAWAYEVMQPVEGVGCKLIPEYHGAGTFSLNTDEPGRRRWVRMLLLQLIDGESVFDKILRATKNGDVQYPLLPDEEFRLRVLKDTLEAEMKIWWDAEVLHGDVSPRNVMIRDDGSVVIIDFNKTVACRFSNREPRRKHGENTNLRPSSPIEDYWPFHPRGNLFAHPERPRGRWADWVPQTWLKDKELIAEWLLETWGSSVGDKYAPLSNYFLNHPAHAERSTKVQMALEKLGRKPAKK
jgi:serine/threonine protein kinase